MGPGPKIKIYKISPKYMGVSEIFISVLCRACFLIYKKWTTFLILFHLKIFPRKFLAIQWNENKQVQALRNVGEDSPTFQKIEYLTSS